MRLQIIYDSDGNSIGVFIPYNEWKKLKKQHKDFAELELKRDISGNIKKGLEEVKAFKEGKLRTTSAKDFLKEELVK